MSASVSENFTTNVLPFVEKPINHSASYDNGI